MATADLQCRFSTSHTFLALSCSWLLRLSITSQCGPTHCQVCHPQYYDIDYHYQYHHYLPLPLLLLLQNLLPLLPALLLLLLLPLLLLLEGCTVIMLCMGACKKYDMSVHHFSRIVCATYMQSAMHSNSATA